MRKEKFVLFIILALVVSFAFSLIACSPLDDDINISEDDNYSVLLRGLVNENEEPLQDIYITKAMIKNLFEEKPVVLTPDNPCYASDKTDVDGNKIPHTLKGVYLEDILLKYTESAGISMYGGMTLNATDGYVTVATEDVFNSQGRGSKMIIAFEYDGILLNVNEKSGALRAVFPDQIANVWAKKLSSIEFSTDILLPPSVNKVYFYEFLDLLGQSVQGEYEKEIEEQEIPYLYNFYGVSLNKLISSKILDAKETDKMHIYGWDYDSNMEDYKEYSAWTKYEVFSTGYLVQEAQKVEGQKEALSNAPVFDGPTMSAGMKVKSVLSISVFNTSIVCLKTAFKKYDPNQENSIYLKDILLLLNMYDEDNSYIITDLAGNETELTAQEVFTSTIQRVGEDTFALKYNNGSKTINIRSIFVKI